jgi:hypothetical protein
VTLSIPKPQRRSKERKPIARKGRPRRRRRGKKAALVWEADRLWSQVIRARGSCEAAGEHSGGLQGAHGFSRRYRNTRWLPINGFCLCAGHHLTYTYDPLAWTDFLIRAWGQDVYDNLKILAQKTTSPDVPAAVGVLREEAARLGIPTSSHDLLLSNVRAAVASAARIETELLSSDLEAEPAQVLPKKEANVTMSQELTYLHRFRVSGSDLKAAMEVRGITKPQLAALLEVSLKTVYNLVNAEDLRGPYRWAAYAIFPSLRPVVVSPEQE